MGLLKNKKGMPIAILLFVISSLVLLMLALAVFNAKQENFDSSLESGKLIETAYVRAEVMKLYLRDISANIDSTSDPVEQFKKQLENYKDSRGQYISPYFMQLDKLADKEHIYIKDNILNVNLELWVLEIPYEALETDMYKLSLKEIWTGSKIIGGQYKILYRYNFNYQRNLATPRKS